MFNRDTDLIFEAYQTTLNEGKMKDIATAIEMGDDVDEIIKDLKLDDTEQVRAYITKERDDFYEKGERADQIDSEDMESCSEEGEPEDQNLIYTDDEGKKIPSPEDGEYQGGMGTYNLSTMDDKGRLQVMKMRLEDLIKDGGTFEEFARTVAYQRDLIAQNSENEEAPEEDELTDDPSVPQDMVKALQEISGEFKRLNQYVDFMTTGRGAQGGFAQAQDKEQKFVR